MKLVWVDDDGELLEHQIPALERAGFSVDVVSDVDAAYRYLRDKSGRYDGVILDIMMGTGDLLLGEDTNGGMTTGHQFLKRLLSEGILGKAKVIAYSIVEDPAVKSAVEALGVRFFKKQAYPGYALRSLAIQEFGKPTHD